MTYHSTPMIHADIIIAHPYCIGHHLYYIEQSSCHIMLSSYHKAHYLYNKVHPYLQEYHSNGIIHKILFMDAWMRVLKSFGKERHDKIFVLINNK